MHVGRKEELIAQSPIPTHTSHKLLSDYRLFLPLSSFVTAQISFSCQQFVHFFGTCHWQSKMSSGIHCCRKSLLLTPFAKQQVGSKVAVNTTRQLRLMRAGLNHSEACPHLPPASAWIHLLRMDRKWRYFAAVHLFENTYTRISTINLLMSSFLIGIILYYNINYYTMAKNKWLSVLKIISNLSKKMFAPLN